MIDKKSFYISLGKKIRQLREKKEMTLVEFSEYTNINLSESSLSFIESGKHHISAYQLYLIFDSLNLSVDNFFKSIPSVIDINNDIIKLSNDDQQKIDQI